MITENLPTLKIHNLTQEQYNRALTNGNIDETALYLTPEEEIDFSIYATVEQMNGKANTSHTHNISDVTDLQSSLDAKQAIVTGGASTITSDNLTANRVLISNSSGKVAVSTTITSTELNYIDGVTSNIQSQLNGKLSTSHNTSTTSHNDIRVSISDLSTKVNNFLDVDDATKDQLSEVLTLIDNNKGTLDSLTTSKINVSDIINNLTTNSTSKVLSAAQGVVIKGLIDGKSNTGHNHDTRYLNTTGDDTKTSGQLKIIDTPKSTTSVMRAQDIRLNGVTNNSGPVTFYAPKEKANLLLFGND